ncbi:hypothetical protein IMSAG049_01750 [Clostridiales bacterium]|nr:hypothetical protein IMSAG049_01750 [Clostridiales bacterium]
MVMYHHDGFAPVIFSIIGSMWTLAVIVFVILMIVGMWKMFEKAGEPGWTSIIPFVNSYMLFKIGWGSGWLFLLGFIPIVNIVVGIMLSIKLAKAFGMGTGFAVGLIFLPSIFYMILGFSDAVYYGPAEN